jgi:CubicO group peptidase (beta-lactamase class C family)
MTMNIALALLAVLPLHARQLDLKETLEPALLELMQRHRLPGMAIGVVKDGEVLYARGFGEATRGSARPVTTSSIFHMVLQRTLRRSR